jgi:adenylosuccinate lyase
MIQRYSRPEMRAIWTEQRKLEIWLRIELLASEALCAQGLVSKKDLAQMKAKAAFGIDRCHELERTLNHDVIAFTTNVAENIGAPASRWLHFGLTSSDVLDTAFAVQMVQSSDILIADVEALREATAVQARRHQMTPMIGRSHGIHAEPTTFGLKLALMYDEFGRALRRLASARSAVAVGKLSGAVGTSAHLSPRIEAFVCKQLGLRPAPLATQVIQRDLHAEFIQTLALVAASIERWATEFRHLQRTEVLEAEEFFSPGQKGIQRHAAQAESDHLRAAHRARAGLAGQRGGSVGECGALA